jgi:isochorismate synthase
MFEEKSHQLKTQNFSSVFKQLAEGQMPFAIWRLPNQKSFQCAISTDPKINLQKIDLELLESGFAFAPYNYYESKKGIFIKADISFNFYNFDETIDEEILDKLELEPEIDFEEINVTAYQFDITENEIDKSNFIQQVNLALDSINEEDFEKVVLSRSKSIERTDSYSPIDHFKKLCDSYPTAFCSLTYLPWDNELWIGATPERLVSQDENGIFKTMALAGTQTSKNSLGVEISEADAMWRQKEIEEQALVSRYIINCFKKIRVREYEEIGPKSIRAGNLIHLQTTFEVKTNEIEFPQLGSIMIDLLHPTSAVCGMPQKAAQTFISQTEDYNRSYYSGFLGPINIKNSTNLFVNLRTLRASKDKLTLFAGCGITKDSDPEKEWNETQIKLKTVAI